MADFKIEGNHIYNCIRAAATSHGLSTETRIMGDCYMVIVGDGSMKYAVGLKKDGSGNIGYAWEIPGMDRPAETDDPMSLMHFIAAIDSLDPVPVPKGSKERLMEKVKSYAND